MLGHFLVSISSVVGKHHMHTSDLGVLASLKNVCVASVASYWNDFSALPLFFLLLVLLLVVKAQSIHGMRRLGWITIGWFFGLPVVFNIVGHYAFYYSYMRFLPLALVCVSVAGSIAANAGTVWRRWVRLAVGVAACTSLCVGLPLRIAVTKHFFNLEPRGKIQHTLEQHLLKNDVVFCDYLAFFGVKNICSRVYVPNSSMDLVPYKVPGNRFSEAEKQAVSVLVVRTDRVAVYTNYFPATWTVMAGPFGDSLNRAALDRVPLFRRRLAHHLAQPQVERQPLLILRRAPRAE